MRRSVVFADEHFEEYHYTSNKFNVNFANDIFTVAGKPFIAGQNWHVFIDAGVTIGSTSVNLPAVRTGAFPRFLKLTVNGKIQGMGGTGGTGARNINAKSGGRGGGGGGGGGVSVGAGGIAYDTAQPGQPGTASSFGYGGQGSGFTTPGPSNDPATPGGQGGDAIWLDNDIRLTINDGGVVWCGGGGGGGADATGSPVADPPLRWGGRGGRAGEQGRRGGDSTQQQGNEFGSGAAGGSRGYAILANGFTITILSYSEGTLLGLPNYGFGS